VTACNNEHDVPWGINRRHVITLKDGESGEKSVSVVCMHCTDAPCAAVCPVECFYTTARGIVLHDKDLCIALDRQDATFCPEIYPPGLGLLCLEYGESARQCRMAAKINLNLWGEPAQLIDVTRLHQERGLGQVVFRSDGLEEAVTACGMICNYLILKARLPRLELGTYGLEVRCSILIELQALWGFSRYRLVSAIDLQ
jgi:hypothetical protein